ncbi:Zeaxanthin epoxidase, chloroplastic [Seminavis robusta]|uniref:Zeaxanthin epoxidase, chloroplastic n=1 Tax=Seminavis robusta TaxID=568900 RepID=A0A9N8EVL7_9STRA|nr:Zeaxanthin epoxidase, chloroplastic [Seminavis robusta]|eukprot:Sro2117_g315250.1 Zeaxanthin epoxidase, chloroplastic (549) ;mRNA; f:8291-9937
MASSTTTSTDPSHLAFTSLPDRPILTVCSKCRGEGKLVQAPSRKARKRYKQSSNDAKKNKNLPPPRIDGCKPCGGSGLVVAATDDEITTNNTSNNNNNYPHVGIVGGGLGGLALAVACRHRGIPFTVYERDANFFERSQGYGLTMQQASRALKALGIPVPLQDGIVSTKHMVHKPDGTVVGEWGLRKWIGNNKKQEQNDKKKNNSNNNKRQNVHIARQALRYELLQALGGPTQVQWGHRLVEFSEQEDRVDLTIEVANNDNTHSEKAKPTIKQTSASLLVGADGIRSSVRRQGLGEEQSPLRYLGCIVILGICPLTHNQVQDLQSPLLDGETVFQTADGSTRIYMMPYSQKEYMWQLSFPMDEQAAMALSQRGPQALKDESLKMCHAWHTPIIPILKQTPATLVSGYPVYDRDVLTKQHLTTTLSSSSSRLRRVTLLGDAAHPMSPFKGQGANQALLDALFLARTIFKDFNNNDNNKNTTQHETTLSNDTSLDCEAAILEKLLETYETEMLERSSVKVEASAKAAHFLHTNVAIQEGNVTRGAAANSK